MKTQRLLSRPLPRPLYGLFPALNKTIAVSGLLTALLTASLTTPAFADDLADVTKAVRAGQYGDALSKADSFLAKHPRDAQMRFLKGVILTEQGKSPEAIVVFTKLTEDFPELPEPYNNLAVLYAAGGQYEKARIALDAAIRTSPTYATAYENLGDIHAKLASQAYDKALQLDSGNANAKSKLTLLRTMAGNSPIAARAAAPATAAIPVAAPASAPITVAAAAPASVPAVKPEPAKASAVASAKPAETPKPKPVEHEDEREQVLAAVHGWAKAWSEQDVKAYLNYYAADFETPKGESRKAWADERHQRIEGKDRIEVKVEAPQVSVKGDTATVKFRQIYSSDRLKADSHKVLTLVRQGGKWQIKQERSGG